MANVCEECNAVNTDGATVCRTCGCPLFLASETPASPPRLAAVMAPAGSRRLVAWFVGGLAAIALLALAAFIFEVAGRPPQRMQFGPDASRFAPVLPDPLIAPASLPNLAAEAAVAASPASAASAVAAPPLHSSSPAPLKGVARKSASANTPVSGNTTPAGAEADSPIANRPTPGPAVPLPAPSETGGTSPSEICGDKSFLALGICLAEQCNTSALFDHPDCVQIREQDNKRREREELGS